MESVSTEYGISDLSHLYGVSLRTLRFYEDKDLLRPRREGMRRFFTENDRIRLEIIVVAKRLGFSLAQIWELLEAHDRSGAGREQRSGALTVAALGLSNQQIRDQLDHLSRERERVHDAIQELRQTAVHVDRPPQDADGLTLNPSAGRAGAWSRHGAPSHRCASPWRRETGAS